MSNRCVIPVALGAILAMGAAVPAHAQDVRDNGAATIVASQSGSSIAVMKEYGLDFEAARNPGARKVLALLSEQNLRDLMEGADPASVVTLTGRTLAQEVGTNALGSFTDELVYSPLNPCRVIDTRNAGGAFAAGEARAYNLIGLTDYSTYGGTAAGCGIPTEYGGGLISYNTVRGLILNVVAANAAGNGNLQAWPTNQTAPTASALNFGTTQSIANGLAFKTCDALCLDFTPPFTCGDPCSSGDLSVKANVSSVHLVVDVVGYFTAASLGSTASTDVAAQTNLATGCHNVAAVGLGNSTNTSKTVICQAYVNVDISHTSGSEDAVYVTLATDDATCATTAAGSAFLEVDTNVPTFVGGQNSTMYASQVFSLGSDTSQTYYLNAQMYGGTDDSILGGKLICFTQP